MSAEQPKLNIVMFNMSGYNEWQRGVQNRNYHLFNNFLLHEKVGQVVAIDYLPHTFKRAIRNYKENILSQSVGEIIFKSPLTRAIKKDEKLTVVSSVANKFSSGKFYNELKEILKRLEIEDYLVWSCYPLNVDYFQKLSPQLFLFDAVDNWAEHDSYKGFKQSLLNNYRVIDQQADIITTVSENLLNLFSRTEKVFWVPNGVDLKHYQLQYNIINKDIGELKHPVVGYVGTIQNRLDQDMLEYLAKNNPDKSFALVGPVWQKSILERFSSLQNVHFLGRKTYEDVPMYIQQFDVAIIPHKLDNFVKSMNPMKIYEYLACGKPVVATKGSGLEMFDEFILATNDYKEFNGFINEALAGDSQWLREQRREAVKDHSWLNRAQRIIDLITNKLS